MKKNVTPICLIAPSGTVAGQSEKTIQKYGKEINVYQATLEDAAVLARQLMKEGAEIFISRRGTRMYLEKEFPGQVAGIEEELADYIPVLEEARRAEGPVAFFRYGSVPENIQTMCLMLGIDARYYPFQDRQDCMRAVREAVLQHAVLGIGGADSAYFSEQLRLRHLTLENSEESLVRAIQMAEQLLALKRAEREKQRRLKVQLEQYEMVFRHTHDAILAVDQEGNIAAWNEEAGKAMRHIPGPYEGKRIDEIFSNMDISELLSPEGREFSQLVHLDGTAFSATGIPIIVDRSVAGVVLILQDVKRIQDHEKRIRLKLHEKGLVAKYCFDDIIGDSPVMMENINLARMFARSEATILILGETGTGKELFAQSIHNGSRRADGPFVAVNCGALPKNLLEAELFGYEEGAFTGARKGGKAGLFEIAHGGTIFLDEIGEMPLETQVQLLRVLQEKEIRRVGSDRVIPVDIRIITATNRDLYQDVQDHMFREDLYYRLNVLNVVIPPLRDRQNDMVKIGLDIFRGYERSAEESDVWFVGKLLESLQNYSWPGNVRELHNLIERIHVLLSQGEKKDFIEKYIQSYLRVVPAKEEAEDTSGELEQWERERLLLALKENELDVTKAAEALGISRSTMFRKIKKYHIRRNL